MTVGVKYCGGCNPRYDRVALVHQLESAYANSVFLPARPGYLYDRLVVVCGCPARCADLSGLATREDGMFVFFTEAQKDTLYIPVTLQF